MAWSQVKARLIRKVAPRTKIWKPIFRSPVFDKLAKHNLKKYHTPKELSSF